MCRVQCPTIYFEGEDSNTFHFICFRNLASLSHFFELCGMLLPLKPLYARGLQPVLWPAPFLLLWNRAIRSVLRVCQSKSQVGPLWALNFVQQCSILDCIRKEVLLWHGVTLQPQTQMPFKLNCRSLTFMFKKRGFRPNNKARTIVYCKHLHTHLHAHILYACMNYSCLFHLIHLYIYGFNN